MIIYMATSTINAEQLAKETDDVLSRVAGGEDVLVLKEGRPIALVVEATGGNYSEAIRNAIVRRAVRAAEELRKDAEEMGLDKLTWDQINEVIREVRREKAGRATGD